MPRAPVNGRTAVPGGEGNSYRWVRDAPWQLYGCNHHNCSEVPGTRAVHPAAIRGLRGHKIRSITVERQTSP
jgi:hypothetical protein